MFIFHRLRSGPTEVYYILLPEGNEADAERFGEPLRYSAHPERFHEVGVVVLVHGEGEVEYLLAGRDGLGEEEQLALYRELEHLVGKEVHALGGEPLSGWYIHDFLRDLSSVREVGGEIEDEG